MRKYLRFILLSIFAVFIFWFFFRNIEWNEVSASLRKADPIYLLAAVAIICLGYFLRALRWKVLLEPITETSIKELFATTTVGFAAVFFVGRAGEIVRPMWLPMRDKRVRPSAALVTLGLERICDLAALVSFFSINLLWLDTPQGRENEFQYARTAGWVMLGGLVAGIASLFVYQRFSGPIIEWADRVTDAGWIHSKLKRVILSVLKQLAASLKILNNPYEVFRVIFWTLALWFAIAIPTWLVIRAFGLPLGFGASLFVMGWASVGSIVPTPGGAAGAFHAATMGGLMFLGVGKEEATATSIIMHLVYFAPAVFFGLYYFFHGDISLERFRSLLSSEHAVEEIESESPDAG